MTAPIDADALRKAMDQGGWSPSKLAAELGVTPRYIRGIMQGRRTLVRNPELVKRMAEVLDVPRRWIVREEVAS